MSGRERCNVVEYITLIMRYAHNIDNTDRLD